VEQLQALKEVVREELRDLQRRAREPRFEARRNRDEPGSGRVGGFPRFAGPGTAAA
jgi:hypothetical protein|tara:strand:+ start:182 stop:349 length:168 start_codon:yes stop_codon:yes gene_type:complete